MENEMTQKVLYYDVFLSYRHKPLDNKICKKTHTLLETFKAPKRYQEARITRCFRDDDELPVAGVLSDTIDEALRKSRILLVVCSPDTPQSQWVDREVRTFIELGRTEFIYALLIKGDPNSSFPPSLRLVPGIENRTLTIESSNERKSIKKLKKELLKIVCAATNAPYEPLRVSLKRRRLVKRIALYTLLSLFLLSSGIFSLFQWLKASYYSLYAEREELVIHDVINSITYDLTQGIQYLPGATSGLIEILTNNVEFLDRMMALGGKKDDSLKEQGNNYMRLSHAYLLQSDSTMAIETTQKGIAIFEEMDKRKVLNKEDLAINYNLGGLYMQYIPMYDNAFDYFKKAISVYRELGDNFSINQAECLNQLARCYFQAGRYTDAADTLEQEITLRRRIMGPAPTLDDQRMLAQLHSSAATSFLWAKEFEKAVNHNKKASEFYQGLMEQMQEPQATKDYVTSLYALGASLAYTKNDTEAEYTLRLCLVAADELVRSSLPEFNATYLSMYAIYDLLYGDETKKAEALSLASLAYNESPDNSFVRHIYAYSLLFDGQKEEARSVLKELIHEGAATPNSIALDLELFTLRGRTDQSLDILVEGLID